MGRAAAATTGGDYSNSRSSSSSSSTDSSFREHENVFLQTQTRIWLGEVLHTRLDDRMDLSELLADGELLFDVSKIAWNMLVKCKGLRHAKESKCNPIGSRKIIGRYRPYSNVDSFLKICKILGLNSVDLFSPSDVVEKRDTRKVCVCIRSFSKKARSKQLKIPDFDIVTYAVTMPTAMVGCLRRNLEPSKCSGKASAEYTSCRDSKSKSRQKNQGVVCDRNNGVCYEMSDDTVGNYMGQLTYGLSKSSSYDSASLKGIDDSPEVSSALCISERDILELEKIDRGLRHYESSCSGEKMRSICSEYGDSNPVLNSISPSSVYSHRSLCSGDVCIDDGFENHETYFPDDASFVGDSLDDMVERLYISPQFPEITLGLHNGSVLFDGEDDIHHLLMGFDSQSSISTARMSQNGFGKRSSDDFEDVEVSSVCSMSSVFGRMLSLDFDEQFDSGDLRHEIHDIDDYENSEYSFTSDATNCIFETENGISGFSNMLPSSSDSRSHTVKNEDYIGSLKNDVTQLNPIKELCLENEEQKTNCRTINKASPVIRACSEGGLVVPDNSSITREKYEELDSLNGELEVEVTQQCSSPINNFDRSCLRHESVCSGELISKDQSKCMNVESMKELSDGKEDGKIKPNKRPLLATVVKGAVVFSTMFFLLHLRSRIGNKNEGEKDKKSYESQHANSLRNPIKALKTGRQNGVYPADKFKFQN